MFWVIICTTSLVSLMFVWRMLVAVGKLFLDIERLEGKE